LKGKKIVMSLTEKQLQDLPESIYTVPDIEWQALLTLAAATNPSKLIKSEQWHASLFASENAQASFQKLIQSNASLSLQVPRSISHVNTFKDPIALQNAQKVLIAFAQFRRLEIVQANLARETRHLAAIRHTENISTLLDTACNAIHNIKTLNTASNTQTRQIATLGELAASYWTQIAKQNNAISTGFIRLDEALGGGLQPQRLIVILGGPGSGKTTLVNQIAERVANSGFPVVYLTTEDTMITLLAKTIARIGHINYGNVLQGHVSQQELINQVLHDLAKHKSAEYLLYIEGNGEILEDLSTVTQQHFTHFADKAQGASGLLIVDYLQRVARAQMKATHNTARDLREAVTTLTENLRDLARNLNCTVIAVASQSRASGYSNTNAITSAKESGDIEYTADVLISLTKDEQRQPPLRCEARALSLVKNRLGSQTTINLNWRADRQQFTETT
jgi:replicative DNA helicase